MMKWRTLGAATAIAIIANFSTVCSAQDVRSQQVALEKEITALNQQIASKQQQITGLRNKPSPEQADVVTAQKALDAARAELKASPGPDSEGKVRNAEFKLKLAQMKADKANSGIETLNDDIDKIKQQVSVKQQQLKELNNQNTEQKVADDRLKRQEQELARTKQEAESAQKEIERLKAALAAQEAAATKSAGAATGAAVTAGAATTAVAKSAASASAPQAVEAASKPVEKPVESAPKPVAATQAATPQTTPTTTATAAAASGLIKLSSQEQVLRELQATSKLAAQASRIDSEASLVLYLKQPGAAAKNKDKLSMRALGNNQYRVSTKVEAGDYEAVIGFNRWPVQFSADEAGDMIFLCDYRDGKAPRLVLYPKTLEGASQ